MLILLPSDFFQENFEKTCKGLEVSFKRTAAYTPDYLEYEITGPVLTLDYIQKCFGKLVVVVDVPLLGEGFIVDVNGNKSSGKEWREALGNLVYQQPQLFGVHIRHTPKAIARCNGTE